MDKMIHALTDLRSSIDQSLAPVEEEEQSTEVWGAQKYLIFTYHS